MFERRYLPVLVVILVALLVTVVSLWAVDRANTQSPLNSSSDGLSSVSYQWKLVTTWPKTCLALERRLKTLPATSTK